MVQFTSFSSGISAQDLVAFLNDMYTRFDEITERHGVYKVEIIGDAYFVVGGCPVPSSDHAKQTLFAGLEMLLEVEKLQQKYGNVQIRIGIHTGPIVAGVVGIKDPRYHLFGETATIAQTLESTGVVGKIHVSETTMRSFQVRECFLSLYKKKKFIDELIRKLPIHRSVLILRKLLMLVMQEINLKRKTQNSQTCFFL